MRKALVLALVVAVIAGLGVAAYRAFTYAYREFTPEVCTVTGPDGGSTQLSPEQARNASTIVAASVELGLPERAAVIAIATAYQESGLRNLDYGDRDSLGLFQQRPSYGWGSEEQIMDPWYSSVRFYEELVTFSDWENTDINDMAQKVQRSGFPEAYRQHVENSQIVVSALRGSSQAALGCRDFSEPVADVTALERVLEALGGSVTVETSPDGLVITGQDEASAWAAAHHVVANSYRAGVTRVTLDGQGWAPDEDQWQDATATGDSRTVTVAVG